MPVVNSLPVNSQFIFQHLLCHNGQGNVKHFSFIVSMILSFLVEGTGRSPPKEGASVLVLVAAPSVSSVDVNTSVALCPSRESRMHGPLMTCNPGLS